MKRIFILLSAAFVFSIMSCGGGGEQKSTQTPVGTIKQEEGTATAQPTPTTNNKAPETKEPVKEEGTAKSLGVGPIKEEIELGPLDDALVKTGETAFKAKCMACHKLDTKIIGPPLGCVHKKRSAAWIMNMILAPDKMVKEDPIAKKLLEEYKTPMANMGINKEEARAILEYLRSKC